MTRFYGPLVNGVPRELLVIAFADYFGVEPGEARVLLALYRNAPEFVDAKALANAINSHKCPPRSSVHAAVCVLRSAMEAEAIDSDRRGYWLTEVGVAECVRCMEDLSRRIVDAVKGRAA